MGDKNPSAPGDTPDSARVDELRQRLRSLGYLDAGVDRFVLGSVRRTRGPVVLALLASLRIGLLAAALLGPAGAIGLAARLPGLVTGPKDALIAALYLGALFGIAMAGAALVAALLTTWITARTGLTGVRLARRMRILSVAAGTIVTITSLTYLAMWWRATSGEGTWSSPLWTSFALAVAAACSLLLGHAVTVTALAITVARSPASGAPAAHSGAASWKASLLGTAAACVAAVALLVTTAGAPASSEAIVPLTVRSSAGPIVLLAVDGFDAALYDRERPELNESNVPTLQTVLDAARVDLAPFASRDPAPLWMTIATGASPERHGVAALETRRIAGLQGQLQSGSSRVVGVATDVLRLTKPAIASNFERRVKTVWEVAEQAGLRTAVVNWWATWPAAGSGIVISDRAVLRLERGGPLDAEIAPPELYERIRSRWTDIRARAQQRTRDYFARAKPARLPDQVTAVLHRSAELDSTMVQLAEAVADTAKLDLLAVYLPGLDIAQFALLGGGAGAPPSELDVRVAGLQRYYAFLTELTGTTIATAFSTRASVVVLSQAGRQHEGRGVLAASGSAFRQHVRINGSVLDVAPTILHALGVPVARDLDGRVLTDLFAADVARASPVRYVDTYGLRGAVSAARGDAPLDQETIERLRSLGYIR